MINEVNLIGNLGRDPEVRCFDNGGKLANLSLGTSRRWKNRNTGEIEERTEWHRVNVTADGLVTYLEKAAQKGTMLYVSGRLETRKWTDQNGVDRYSTEVVVAPYEGVLKVLKGGRDFSSSRPLDGRETTAARPELDDEIPF